MRAADEPARVSRTLCFMALVSAAGSLGHPATAWAGWTSSGPFGGAAEVVRVVPKPPGVVLAATANAMLYRSTNGGASWTRLPFPAQFAGTLHALEVDPRAPGTWYAGIESTNPAVAGVYRTQDSAATWHSLAGLKGRSVWALAQWPADPRTIAAGTDEGVFLSNDGGDSWARISPASNTDLRPVVSLAFDPSDRRILYAGTLHLPWRTRNGGADWESIHSGMLDDSDVFSVAVETDSSQSVFASACSGVYRSGNGASSWSRLPTPSGAFRTYLVALDPAHPGVVFAATSAGLLRSANRGAAWTRVTPQVVRSMAFDPVNHDKIYLASSTAGLLISRDGGRTVLDFNTGFVNRNFTDAAASGPVLYVASVYEPGSGGIFRSLNHGLRWDLLAGPGADENIVRLAAAPDNPRLLYAASYHGLFRSADGGNSWSKPIPPPGGGRIQELAALSDGRLLAGTAAGLFALTHDAWTDVPLPGPGAIEQLQSSPGGEVAALTATAVFQSRDGIRWTACGPPDPDGAWYGLAFDSAGDVALAATSRGLFRSVDGCTTWKAVRGGLEAATTSAVVFHPDRPGEAYVAQSGHIFGSFDGGVTWKPLANDDPSGAYPDRLFFLPGAPQRLFGLFPRRGLLSHSIDGAAVSVPAATQYHSRGAN